MDYMEIGTTPYDEDCVQVESTGAYLQPMRRECDRYKTLLEEIFPIPQDVNAYFSIKSCPHDFGTYYECIIKYDETDEKSSEFALFVEGNLPRTWKDQTIRTFAYVPSESEDCNG
jgi:hypothetical protein